MIGETIGHYRIERRLGEGGMGVVYEALDRRLERSVALKLLRAELNDPQLLQRFQREARAAAALNHPGICQVYELGESDGRPFIVMELLEGEPLADHLARQPTLPPGEVARIGIAVLEALGALHQRGFVHRDVKPSNVFLLGDGRVKLLDFGLVHPKSESGGRTMTMTGTVMGSPGYMAPEQIRSEPVDPRTDLFALATTLLEASSGRPVFRGKSAVDVMHAVLHERPQTPVGSREVEALTRVLMRSLSKNPDERHANAAAMAADLRPLLPSGATAPLPAMEVARLAVLPFRMLRLDAEREFLGPSLADAIAMSLAGIHSLVVRSPMAAARFATGQPDLREIARELDVDSVLIGTILPAGERCRVAAQLVEVPGGNVTWSITEDVVGRDVFHIQDTLTRRIVESLQLPLSSRERRSLARDVPATPTAYEFFLRANRLAEIGSDLIMARDLYLKSIEADPDYAPAWVRLARCYRVTGKYYVVDRQLNYRKAEEALARAFELHPDIPIGHQVMAAIELDRGRSEQALDRLLGVLERNPNDVGSFVQMMTGFRYLGLLEESLASERRLRVLDPEVRTSLIHTLDALGDLEGALAEARKHDPFETSWVLMQMGRTEEAVKEADKSLQILGTNSFGLYVRTVKNVIQGDLSLIPQLVEDYADFPDPEGLYNLARMLVRAGSRAHALEFFRRAITQGYACLPLIQREESLQALRGDPEYDALVRQAEEHHLAARAKYGGRIS
jgi:TolB-like protein/tetratricopeptide (TPR) repeat protein/predicted Ser/Thr protein kinase